VKTQLRTKAKFYGTVLNDFLPILAERMVEDMMREMEEDAAPEEPNSRWASLFRANPVVRQLTLQFLMQYATTQDHVGLSQFVSILSSLQDDCEESDDVEARAMVYFGPERIEQELGPFLYSIAEVAASTPEGGCSVDFNTQVLDEILMSFIEQSESARLGALVVLASPTGLDTSSPLSDYLKKIVDAEQKAGVEGRAKPLALSKAYSALLESRRDAIGEGTESSQLIALLQHHSKP